MSKKSKRKKTTPAPRRIATRDTATPNRPAGVRRLVTIELTIETDLTRRELSVRSNYAGVATHIGPLPYQPHPCPVRRVKFIEDHYAPPKTAKRSERSPS